MAHFNVHDFASRRVYHRDTVRQLGLRLGQQLIPLLFAPVIAHATRHRTREAVALALDRIVTTLLQSSPPVSPPTPIVNIAAYRFVPLPDAEGLVAPLREHAESLALKGTIIVATEGINLFLAGEAVAIDAFLAFLANDLRMVDGDGRPAFVDLTVKRSASDTQPFRRLGVKCKAEIVTMRRPAIRPAASRAPAIAPERLRAWLAQGHDDEGRPVTLLDTRNAFEFEHGAFDGARHLGLERFDAFPAALDEALDTLRDETVVTYCTGGIRCEKAALYMQDRGLARVYQLDGGILNYFERVGDAHWHGDCFVFDERRVLDPTLKTASSSD